MTVAQDEGSGVGLRAPVRLGGRRCSGEAEDHVAEGPKSQAPERHLEGGGVDGVADEADAEEVRAYVCCARAPDPDGAVADPAEVLHEGQRSRLDDLDAADHRATSTNRTVVPGTRRAGGCRAASQSTMSVVPISCHPPGDSRG